MYERWKGLVSILVPRDHIEQIAIIRYLYKVLYPVCAGYANAALGEENAPHYTTFCRRINKLKVVITDDAITIKSGAKTLSHSRRYGNRPNYS